MKHYYEWDSDRCVCGGVVVYFEDGPGVGEGCEVEGRPWQPAFPVRVRKRGTYWDVVDLFGGVITSKFDEITALEAADRLNDQFETLTRAEQAGIDVTDL